MAEQHFNMKHNLIGQRFHRWTVLAEAPRRKYMRRWFSICDCGTQGIPYQTSLLNGDSKSCGCLKDENSLGKRTTKHGRTRTPEYRSWRHLIERCTNPRDHAFARYGGRGIRVCKQWLESFTAFYADVGPKPSPQHSIDRINNDGDYEPNNVRWATRQEQINNRSSSKYLTYENRTMTLLAWAKEKGMPPHRLRDRIDRYGWSIHKALTEPKHANQFALSKER